MAFSLKQLASGMFSRVLLNSNFEKIEDKVNDDLVHRQDGSAQMGQDLDMNGNSILNVADVLLEGGQSLSIYSETAVNAASIATTKADEAATSATDSASSATSAANDRLLAESASNFAADKAFEAAGYASSASSDSLVALQAKQDTEALKTIATTQASNAAASATTATTAATSATASATLAGQHLSAIETIYDNFDDRYLGAFALDPTVDNDGNALLTGAIYFNTVDEDTRFYNGVSWERPEYTATQAASSATSSATTATQAASNALASSVSAGTSAANASTSKVAAETAATTATTQATTATTQATNAAASAATAVTKASEASTSATNASNSAAYAQSYSFIATSQAGIAGNKADEAANSAAEASGYLADVESNATAAAASETNAATSASEAATSAAVASESATLAAGSAFSAEYSSNQAATKAGEAWNSAQSAYISSTNSQTSALTAASHANTATTKADEASTSADNAATSATNAAASATSAIGSATAATNSALSASTYATQASSSASSASTSASNASVSASNALTYKNDAESSASAAYSYSIDAGTAKAAAEAARDQALAAFDNFDDKYLGEKSSDPALDNDGNALVAGALYFNTTDNSMKVYSGSVWLSAYASLSGALLSANNLSDLSNTAAARINIGLGNVDNTADSAKNVLSATKLTTARSIALTGDVTGSVSFDGSANATITATVVDDSHNHVISNVDGLQTALDGKLSTTGKAADSDKLDGLDSSAFARAYRFSAGSSNGALRYVRLFTIGSSDDLVIGTLTNTGDFGDPTRSIYQIVVGTRSSILDMAVFQTIKGTTTDEYAFYYKPVTSAYEIWARMSDYNLGNVFTELNAQSDVTYQFDSVTTTAPDGLVLVPTTKMWHSDNDGSGSGLDADTLDSVQASQFVRSDVDGTVSGNLDFTSEFSNLPSHYYHNLYSGNVVYEHAYPSGSDLLTISPTRFTWRVAGNNTYQRMELVGLDASLPELRIENNKVWHAGNDGAGSGLDADTLDGIQASGFAVTNATETVSGGVKARIDGNSLYLTTNGSNP